MNHYKEIKNIIHNGLKLTKEEILDSIREICLDEISKQTQRYIEEKYNENILDNMMRRQLNNIVDKEIREMGGAKFTHVKDFNFVNNLILERIDKLIKTRVDDIVTDKLIYEALKQRFEKGGI